jgi:predicted amidophosphoribosyltransferase
MPLQKCELCGRAFNSAGAKLCASCADEIDNSYIKVRKYIYQNPDKRSFAAIVEATDVSEKALSYLIDHGRVVVVDAGSGRGVRCKVCGAVTDGGTLCEKCRTRLVSEKLLTVQYGSSKKRDAADNSIQITMLKRGKKNED